MQVFVLVFNAGTDNEGIYTLKVKDPTEGSQLSKDVVLAFEVEDDAARYALLLEAQDFPSATAEAIARFEIEEFCREAGLEMQFIPEGTLAVPPEANLEQMDWQPDQAGPNDSGSELSDSDALERIRRQLEGLL